MSAATLEAALASFDDLIDDRVGIVRSIELVRRDAGDPDFFHVAGKACNTAAFCRQANFGNTGGASADLAVAAAKAVGEAVERYASAVFDHEDFPLSTYDAAPFDCVAPEDFALYSAEQHAEAGFPWAPFTKGTPVRWTQGRDAATGRPLAVPAAMVLMPYTYYESEGEVPVAQPISTGLACHMGRARAELGAICEVVERDAFTLTWQAGMARAQVRIETLSDENYDLVKRFESTGATVTMLDITTDCGIPTILSVLQNDAPHCAAFLVAAATDLDPETAARKSLEELAHTRRYSQQVKTHLPRLDPDRLDEITDQVDHLNFWCDHANAPKAEFLFASSERIDFEDIPDRSRRDPAADLATAVALVAATGHRTVLCDLTTPDVATVGLHVARAVIPGFHPLFMGFRNRALGGRRLREVPERLGVPHRLPETGDIGLPHPYP